MPEGVYSLCLTLFVVGFLGGGHCFGMCGGIVAALTVGQAGQASLPRHFAYNLGRILSYMLAGALVGWFGQGGLGFLQDQWVLRALLFFVANLVLLATAFYLIGFPLFLQPLERIGQGVWGRIQPLTRFFLPVQGVRQAFPLGVLWGWLPCGLVYGALINALSTGSPGGGALVMLAFGLGTLPALLLAGVLSGQFRPFFQHPWVRRVAGVGVLLFALHGFWGLWHLLGSLSVH